MVESLTPKYEKDPRFAEAADALALHLGLNKGDVTISRDPVPHTRNDNGYGNQIIGESFSPATSNLTTVPLHFEIHVQGTDVNEKAAKLALRERMKSVAPIAAKGQFELAENQLVALKNELEATTADIKPEDKKHLAELINDWSYSDTKIIEKEGAPPPHALVGTNIDAYGTELRFKLPTLKEVEMKGLKDRLDKHFKDNESAILALMEEETVKYAKSNWVREGKNPDEIAELEARARADIKTAKIVPQSAEGTFDGGIYKVIIRSKKQTEAFEALTEKYRYNPEPDNGKELRDSNPLNYLTSTPIEATETTPAQSPQLHRAMVRSLFFDKEKHHLPEFVQIAGTADMHNMLQHEMGHLAAKFPEKKEAFVKILESEFFKNHSNWRGVAGAGDALPEVNIQRIAGENDLLGFQLLLTQNNDPKVIDNAVETLLTELSKLPPAQQQQQSPASEPPAPAMEGVINKILEEGPKSQEGFAAQIPQSQPTVVKPREKGWIESATDTVSNALGFGRA